MSIGPIEMWHLGGGVPRRGANPLHGGADGLTTEESVTGSTVRAKAAAGAPGA